MRVFRSKVDLWILLVFIALILFSIFASIEVILNSTGLIYQFIVLIIISLGVIFPIWLLVSTKYTISEDNLLIESGPIKQKVKISTIREVRKTRSILSSPALSMDRIEIKYEKYKSVIISPKNVEEFLIAINQKAI